MKARAIFQSTLLSALATAALAPTCFHAQEESSASIEKALESIETDLATELEKLATLRQTISEERPPLAKETNEISAELRETRRGHAIAMAEAGEAEALVERNDRELKASRDERIYIEGLLADFTKTYQARQSVARVDRDRELLLDDSLTGAEQLLTRSIEQLSNVGRVAPVEGSIATPSGEVVEGRFVEIGPYSWFIDSSGTTGGLVKETADLRTEWVEGKGDAAVVSSLLAGNPTEIDIDPTLGNAIAMEQEKGGVIEHIRQGGFWIYPILFLAAVALITAVVKWIQFLRIREVKPARIDNVIQAVNSDDEATALAETSEIRHPARQLLEAGVLEETESREALEETLYQQYLAALPPLQRGLAFIAIASATAPLLGLLGTVTGMIETFQLINIFGTGDAKSLASGISEALVTTEFGLAVAIPALILHALLSRKVQRIRNSLEMISLAFINGVTRPKTSES